MSKQIIADLIRIAVRKAIVAPLANMLGFGDGGGGISSAISSVLGFKRAAIGTNRSPGGLTLVGEAGPELLNIPKNGQIIPHNKLKMTPPPAANNNARSINLTTNVYANDAVLASTLRQEIAAAQVQTLGAADAMSRDQQQKRARRVYK